MKKRVERAKFNLGDGGFLIGYQLLFFIALPLHLLFFTQQTAMWLVMLALVFLCGISITTLYHRCYSHRSCELHPIIQGFLLFFATLSVQGSALQWSYDHRLHHNHVDTKKDPYSITRGFWDAHFLWMLRKRDKANPAATPDLAQNKLVMFQHKHYVPLMIITNFSIIVFFGFLFNNFLGAFIILFLTRLFINHHTTWFINSLAHTLGSQPFSKQHTAVNNWLVSFVTYGEGYHNFHHTFPGDYRNGIRWWQYDPGKFLLWALNKVKLATVRKIPRESIIKKSLEHEKKFLLERIRKNAYLNCQKLEADINKRFSRIQEKTFALQKANNNYRSDIYKAFRKEVKSWKKFYNSMLKVSRLMSESV